MAYWLFQANPKYSRIMNALRELEQIHWLVTRYHREILSGDEVLIWVSGKQSGIYAIAQVLQPPHFVDIPPEIDYWILPMLAYGRDYAPVQITHRLLDNPLLKQDLVRDSILKRLQVIRAPHNTNFKVTPQEWQRVTSWLRDS